MADYNSSYTGPQIDSAIGKVTNKIVETSADKVSFTKGDTGLSANNVQDAIEELSQNSGGTTTPRTYKVVVGTSQAGWTQNDCDFLCTGSNDQNIINQAILSLPSSGGIVWFLNGTYAFFDTLTISSQNVVLEGSGKSTIFSNLGSQSLITASGDNIKIRNISIEDERGTSVSRASIIINGTNFCLDECFFIESSSNPKSMSIGGTATDTIIQNSYFNRLEAISFSGYNGLRVYNCKRKGDIKGTNYWIVASGDNISIIDNSVNNVSTAIDLQLVKRAIVANNYINNCDSGILTEGDCASVNILNNIILNFSQDGIFTSSQYNQYINVSGNYVGIDDTTMGPPGSAIAVAGERNVVTSNITPQSEIVTLGSRVLIDNNSY